MNFVESYGQLNQLSGNQHAEIIKTLQDWFDASWDFASDTESWICDQEGEDSFSEDTIGYALACAFIYWYSKEGYYEVDLLKHDSPRIRLIQASYANEDQKKSIAHGDYLMTRMLILIYKISLTTSGLGVGFAQALTIVENESR